MIKRHKIYVYCNILKVLLASEVYSFYLCPMFPYKQELICIKVWDKKEGK